MIESREHRLVLARAVLDGDEESHLILADLLEDEGSRSAAEWARAKKRNHYKRMDFVIGVLPYSLALQIACDSLSHSLGVFEKFGNQLRYSKVQHVRPVTRLVEAVDAVSRWAQGYGEECDLERPLQTVTAVTRGHYNIHDIDLLMQALHVAVTSATIARTQEARGADARTHVSSSRDASRRVTRGARQMVKPVVADLMWQARQANRVQLDETPKGVPNVTAWQLEHMKFVLDAAIASGD